MNSRGGFLSLPLLAVLSVVAFSIGFCPPHLYPTLKGRSALSNISTPRSAVIYPPLLAAYITVQGMTTHVGAISEAEQTFIESGLFGHIFPVLEHLPKLVTLGRMSAIPGDPEQILLLSPDEVLVWSWASGGLEKVGVPLKRIMSPNTIESWRELGDCAHDTQRANTLLNSSELSKAKLIQTIDRLPGSKGERALILWRNSPGIWQVAGDAHHAAQYLVALGANHPPALLFGKHISIGSQQIDREQLLKIDPDIIFLSCCAAVNDIPQTFYDDLAMRPLKAVREHRIYKQPVGGARMDGVVEMPLLLRWYAELLYPNQLDNEFRDEFKHVYRRVYDFSIGDDELDAAIFLKENRISSGYMRFAR